MPQSCNVCLHPMVEQIDLYFARGGLVGAAEVMWAPLDYGELTKHRDEHIKGLTMHVSSDPIRIVRLLQDLTELSRAAVQTALEEKNLNKLLPCIRMALQCVKAEAELTGMHKQYDPRALDPHWRKLQQALLSMVEKYPEARKEVVGALDYIQRGERGDMQ